MNITLKFIDETLLSLDDLLQKKGGGSCPQSQALADAFFIISALKQTIEGRT